MKSGAEGWSRSRPRSLTAVLGLQLGLAFIGSDCLARFCGLLHLWLRSRWDRPISSGHPYRWPPLYRRIPRHASTSATIGRVCCGGDQGFPVVFSLKKHALSGFRAPAGAKLLWPLARRHFALCDLNGLFGKSKTSTGSRTEQSPRAKRNNGGAMVEDDPNSRQQRPRHDRLGEPRESGTNPSGRL